MATRDAQEGRHRPVKEHLSIADGRRKREQRVTSVRRQAREEILMKRRNITASNEDDQCVLAAMAQLPAFLELIGSDDPEQQYEGAQGIRELLSFEAKAPIKEVVETGVVMRLVELLRADDYDDIQFEAAWSLTNITSGPAEFTQQVVDLNAIPELVRLLDVAENDRVREQAVWALGNIAGDTPALRNRVLEAGALPIVLRQLEISSRRSTLRNSTWTLANLCRGKPLPPWNFVGPAVGPLTSLLSAPDDEIITDACWALVYLSAGPSERIQAIIEAGCCQRLVKLLLHPSLAVRSPALRACGNILTGDDLQTESMLRANILHPLSTLLGSTVVAIKKEAAWAVSNITAGSDEQIQWVIRGGLVPPLVAEVDSAPYEVKAECAWALCNALVGGTPSQITIMVERGCVESLSNLIPQADARVIGVILQAFGRVLEVGEDMAEEDPQFQGVNPYTQLIERCGGLAHIEKLQLHTSDIIYKLSQLILERFFEASEVEPGDFEEGLSRTTVDASGNSFFQFGLSNGGA